MKPESVQEDGFSAAAAAPPAVVFEGISVTLNGIAILRNVSARVPAGCCTAVVGPNGAGKTTLLLALLERIPYRGEIRRAVSVRAGDARQRVGYVPQRLVFDRGMPLTAMEFMVGGIQRLPLWCGCRARHRIRSRELLEAVGAGHLAGRLLGDLSGGEMQRLLLAAALQQDPELLILDEPAAGVDVRGEQLLCDLLDKLRLRHGFTQLMVTHDLATVAAHAEHVICLNRRVTGEGPPGETLCAGVLTETFGIHMGTLNARAPGTCAAPSEQRVDNPHALS